MIQTTHAVRMIFPGFQSNMLFTLATGAGLRRRLQVRRMRTSLKPPVAKTGVVARGLDLAYFIFTSEAAKIFQRSWSFES